MSEVAVLAAVETTAAGIPGITVTRQGWPVALPWTGGIGVVLYKDPSSERRKQITGGGTAGIVQHDYALVLRCIVGPADLDPVAALALATLYDDRFRAAYYADRTLGGTCTQSELGQATDNLLTYRRDQVEPAVAWRLSVTEHVRAGAASQT